MYLHNSAPPHPPDLTKNWDKLSLDARFLFALTKITNVFWSDLQSITEGSPGVVVFNSFLNHHLVQGWRGRGFRFFFFVESCINVSHDSTTYATTAAMLTQFLQSRGSGTEQKKKRNYNHRPSNRSKPPKSRGLKNLPQEVLKFRSHIVRFT